jgi:hypothetical protein
MEVKKLKGDQMKKAIVFVTLVVFLVFASMSCKKASPASPAATPSPCPTFSFGFGSFYTFGIAVNTNTIFASKYNTPTPAKVTGFSFEASNSGHVICAIYSDNAGVPQDLIAQTSFTTLDYSGTETVNLAVPVNIGAGDYWIACLADSNMVNAINSGTGGSKVILSPSNGYGALQSVFSANGTVLTNANYYLEINALCTCQ